MALFIVRFQDTSQFSVASHVESSIGGKHNQSGAAVSPANHILHTNPQLYRTEGKMPLKMTLGRTVLLKCEPRTLVQTTSSTTFLNLHVGTVTSAPTTQRNTFSVPRVALYC